MFNGFQLYGNLFGSYFLGRGVFAGSHSSCCSALSKVTGTIWAAALQPPARFGEVLGRERRCLVPSASEPMVFFLGQGFDLLLFLDHEAVSRKPGFRTVLLILPAASPAEGLPELSCRSCCRSCGQKMQMEWRASFAPVTRP